MEFYTAVFDGKVFVPNEPVDLRPNAQVRVTLEPQVETEEANRRRREALEWLTKNPVRGLGFDWAELDRGDLYS